MQQAAAAAAAAAASTLDVDENLNSQLIDAVTLNEHDRVDQLLFEQNADPLWQRAADGKFALLAAARNGNLRAVNLLVSKLPRPKEQINTTSDKTGWFALDTAVKYGHTEVVRVLLEHGADPNMQTIRLDSFPLLTAVEVGRVDAIPLLLRARVNVNQTSPQTGRFPLLAAAEAGRADIIDQLFTADDAFGTPDPNQRQADTGVFPLLAAAWNLNTAAAIKLLRFGARPSERRKGDGECALLVAARNGDATLIAELIRKHVDRDIYNADGLNPLQLARDHIAAVAALTLPSPVPTPPVPGTPRVAVGSAGGSAGGGGGSGKRPTGARSGGGRRPLLAPRALGADSSETPSGGWESAGRLHHREDPKASPPVGTPPSGSATAASQQQHPQQLDEEVADDGDDEDGGDFGWDYDDDAYYDGEEAAGAAAAPSPPLPEIPEGLKREDVVCKLGSGSYGCVYRVRYRQPERFGGVMPIDGESNDEVAVKHVPADDFKELCKVRNEANAMRRLSNSKHVVRLLRFNTHRIPNPAATKPGQYKFNCFIYLELMAGTLENAGALPEAITRDYVRDLLTGLKEMHEMGFMHRDIKPANLLVCAHTGRIKLGDFGLSRDTNKRAGGSSIAWPKGTPQYMAPEIGQAKYTAACDIWSAACTWLTLLTGRLPWEGVLPSDLGPFQIIVAVCNEADKLPNMPATLPADVRELLATMLRRVPEDRPTAAELLRHPYFTRPLRARPVPPPAAL